MFLAERGVVLDASARGVLQKIRERHMDALDRCVEIVQAVTAADPVWLRRAIDEAEQSGLVPHAARMRILLAQMTGDKGPLQEARPVLERLRDRQFLRRLEEVEAAL
jgi:hypothetical protein